MKIVIEKINEIFPRKLEIETNEKKNLVIFAPNGVGKTTIFQNIVSKEETFVKVLYNNSKHENFLFFDETEINSFENFKENFLYYIDRDIFDSVSSMIKKIKSKIEKHTKKYDFNLFEEGNDNKEFFNFLLNLKEILSLSSNDEVLTQKQYNDFLEISKIIESLDFSKINKELVGVGGKNKIKDILEKEASFHESNKISDLEIINYINNHNAGDRFVYKYFPNVNLKKWKENEEMRKFFDNCKYSYDDKQFIDKILSNQMLQNFIVNEIDNRMNVGNKLKDKFDTNSIQFKVLKEKYCILENKNEFQKIISEFEKESEIYLKKINEKIKKINFLFKKEILEWKLEIESIDNFSSYKNINVKYYKNIDGIYILREELTPSMGELKILQLISKILEVEEDQIIIVDDVFSSLDNSHIDEFINLFFSSQELVLENEKNINIPKIILTHNYELFRTIALKINRKKCSFFLLDKFINNKKDDILLIEIINSNYIKDIKMEDFINNLDDSWIIGCFFTLINILFQDIENNIQINNKNKEIKKLSLFLNNNIRHYRNVEKKLDSILNDLFKNNFLQAIPIFLELNEIKNKIEKIDRTVFEIIKDFNERMGVPRNIHEYLIYKIIKAMAIRFTYEKVYYDSEIKSNMYKKEKWNIGDKDINRDFRKWKFEIKDSSFNIDFLNHVSSNQWSRIFEIQLKKIQLNEDEIK